MGRLHHDEERGFSKFCGLPTGYNRLLRLDDEIFLNVGSSALSNRLCGDLGFGFDRLFGLGKDTRKKS